MQIYVNTTQTGHSSIGQEAEVDWGVFYALLPRLKNNLIVSSSLACGFVTGDFFFF